MSKEPTIKKEVRIPESIVREIEQEAEKKGTDLSKETVYRLRNYKRSLTPKIVVMVQNIVNHALAAAMKGSVESIKKLQWEVNELWKHLK